MELDVWPRTLEITRIENLVIVRSMPSGSIVYSGEDYRRAWQIAQIYLLGFNQQQTQQSNPSIS